MNPLDQRLADLFADEAPARAPGHLAETVIAATAPRRPRPRWRTLLQETPMRLDRRPVFGSPPLRTASLLLVTLLIALLAVGTVVAASSLLTPGPSLVPPERGTFAVTGATTTDFREDSTAITLLDGRVLVVGGWALGGIAAAEVWDPATGRFSPAGTLAQGREGHTATLLRDGRVLIVGGSGDVAPSGDGRTLASAEVWDPRTMLFSPAGSLAHPRYGARASLLPDGRVLVYGGQDTGPVATAEVWDPATGSFSPAEAPADASAPDCVRLADGRVLVVFYDGSAILWDPATGRPTATGSLSGRRSSFTATLLADGRVLVAGGEVDQRGCAGSTPRPDGSCAGLGISSSTASASAEIWDPTTGTFRATGSLGVPRFRHASALLHDGRVLIVGGHGGQGTTTAEVFELR